jgi:hypothetical protein
LPVRDLFTDSFGLYDADVANKMFGTQATGKAVIVPS